MASTFERVKTVIIEQLEANEEEVTPDVSLYDDLCLDSAEMVFVLALEDEFGITIPDDDMERLSARVGDLVAYIDERLRAQ